MSSAEQFRHLKRGDAETYTLVSDSGERLPLEWYMWMGVRNIAAMIGGWVPKGTEPPEGWDPSKPWSGSYDTTEGQLVTAADARALGEAMAQFSITIVEWMDAVKAMGPELPPEVQIDVAPLRQLLEGSGVPQEILEAQTAAIIDEVAEFCRKGAFRIR